MSLYNIGRQFGITNLYIYNIETKTKEAKILQTPEPLDDSTCMTQLPDGKLFCFGNYKTSGITTIVDRNCKVQILTSGTPCLYSSVIYFNNNIYCFGGINGSDFLTQSCRFNISENRWVQLTPMPSADYRCNCVVLNRNILVSGMVNRSLLLYSIGIDSWTTIDTRFAYNHRKILIKAEKIYLIESPGSIYESDIEDEYAWKRVASTKNNLVEQPRYLYNDGSIYIGCINSINFEDHIEFYYKFDLNKKSIKQIF